MSRAKTALPVEMLFGGQTHVGQRRHVMHIVTTWRIHMSDQCAAVVSLHVKLL